MDAAADLADERHRRRAAGWFLTLLFAHTVPIPFAAAVVGGFAPLAGLLVAGAAILFTVGGEGSLFGALLLVPGLAGLAVMRVAGAVVARQVLARAASPRRTLLIIAAIACVVALLPIFVVGGHSSSSAVSLLGWLRQLTPWLPWVLAYFALLVVIMAALLGVLEREAWPARVLNRRSAFVAVGLFAAAFLQHNYVMLFCRPLALAGNADAQYCIGKARVAERARYAVKTNTRFDAPGAVSWLEMAAEQGHMDAFDLLFESTPGGQHKLEWLYLAAERGRVDARVHLFYRLYLPEATLEQRLEALGHLRRAAETGSGQARRYLGLIDVGQSDAALDEAVRASVGRSTPLGRLLRRLGWPAPEVPAPSR